MEIKNNLKIGSLEFKITSEKIYIETITGSETYALRSINGVSVKDNIDLFNEELLHIKGIRKNQKIVLFFGVMIGIIALIEGYPLFFLVGVILTLPFFFRKPSEEIRLQSIVTITMNSGDKAFNFFKDEANAVDVAEFVATLENTLTAFHKG